MHVPSTRTQFTILGKSFKEALTASKDGKGPVSGTQGQPHVQTRSSGIRYRQEQCETVQTAPTVVLNADLI